MGVNLISASWNGDIDIVSIPSMLGTQVMKWCTKTGRALGFISSVPPFSMDAHENPWKCMRMTGWQMGFFRRFPAGYAPPFSMRILFFPGQHGSWRSPSKAIALRTVDTKITTCRHFYAQPVDQIPQFPWLSECECQPRKICSKQKSKTYTLQHRPDWIPAYPAGQRVFYFSVSLRAGHSTWTRTWGALGIAKSTKLRLS